MCHALASYRPSDLPPMACTRGQVHAASRMHLLLAAEPTRWREQPAAALEAAFAHVEAELRREYESHPDNRSGTCALCALLRGENERPPRPHQHPPRPPPSVPHG